MTAWITIIASAATILASLLGWWIAGAKKRKAKREQAEREALRRAMADKDVDTIDDLLSGHGV